MSVDLICWGVLRPALDSRVEWRRDERLDWCGVGSNVLPFW